MPWCVSICQLDTENAPESSLKGENQKKGRTVKKNNEQRAFSGATSLFLKQNVLDLGSLASWVPSEVHCKKKSSIFPHGFEKAV